MKKENCFDVIDIPPLFPEALKETKKMQNDKEMFETFSNCELNVPLLKLVEGVPRFAKFLKELCTIKTKSKGTLQEEKQDQRNNSSIGR